MQSGDSRFGFLVVGHGTRRHAGVQQVLEVGDQLSRILYPAAVQVGLLELAEPTIKEAVAQLAARGVREFITVPILLFSAGHAQRDIPEAVDRAASAYGLKSIEQTAPLDEHPAIVQLSADRFREAMSTCGLAGPSQSIGLAMIGRGSQYPEAHQAMLRFTMLRRRLTRVDWCETGFITGQKPTVFEVLDRLEATHCDLLAIQPHLLFEGELVDELRAEVAKRQMTSNRRWLMTGTLGTDEKLAQALAAVAKQAGRATGDTAGTRTM